MDERATGDEAARQLLPRVDERARDQLRGWTKLPSVLGAHMRAAGRAWPDIEVDLSRFVDGAARAVNASDDPRAALEALFAPDLHLAGACAVGDAAALAAFDRDLLPAACASLSRLGLSASDRDEVAQRLRERLLVSDGARGLAIASYSGRGPLPGWLRTAAAREALKLRRRAHNDDVPLDEEWDAAGGDAELAEVKRLDQGRFKAAVEAAIARLTPRERNVLRLNVLDGESIDAIGAVYAVHRATAARWLDRARERVSELVRDQLVGDGALASADYASLLRLVRSDLELSLPRVLQSAAAEADEPPR